MPLRQTSAVVVRSLDYGESDRIVTFVTPDAGRLTGIAKGARKSRRRFGAALELFTFVRLTYFEKPAFDLVRLESAEILASFPDARRDLVKIAQAAYLVEAAGRAVQPREPALPVFRLLVETLGAVDAEPPDERRLRAFELRLLALLGYHPELRRCARCRRPRPETGRFRVSVQAGGLLCRTCSGEPDWDGAGLAAEPVGASAKALAGRKAGEASAGPTPRSGRGGAPAGPPDSRADYVAVSGRLLDRMADLLDLAEAHPERVVPLDLEPAEALEARRLLPRLLASHLGTEFRSLGFLDRLAHDNP
ncbi:MAG TPA: DNA repair protein RecO [Thermodesulfobacteriota bacterium]